MRRRYLCRRNHARDTHGDSQGRICHALWWWHGNWLQRGLNYICVFPLICDLPESKLLDIPCSMARHVQRFCISEPAIVVQYAKAYHLHLS